MLFFVFALFGAVSLLSYVLPWVLQGLLFKEQNLKTKYNATWALVTGASSGIGKAISDKLASQGINVVMVALADKLLEDSFKELSKKYPKVQFRSCGTDLSSGDYMAAIIDATKGLDINLVFNNAGYINTGFFHAVPLERWLRNYECNATCGMKITHHFASLMVEKNRKGLITFTSSSAGFIAGPLSSTYASTKAFLTTFAASIAPELKSFGIDVLVVHPSPIKSNFLSNSGGMKVLDSSAKVAVSPMVIAETLFACAGRCVVRDQGPTSFGLKLLVKFIDWNLLSDIFPHVSFLMGDFQEFKKKLKKN